mmetsp:Transcript_54568/g.128134  ORF Transcript_54568/g.128134 Transcript_54568/m.128134 type:complete len:109 (+) Transcript_54568:70-396(+)
MTPPLSAWAAGGGLCCSSEWSWYTWLLDTTFLVCSQHLGLELPLAHRTALQLVAKGVEGVGCCRRRSGRHGLPPRRPPWFLFGALQTYFLMSFKPTGKESSLAELTRQ